ncbi:GNAT family N-acetyltransferase, partial [Rhizobium sp. BR5]
GFETIRLETHAQNEPAVAFFRHHGYSVRWLSVSYAPKLDREVQS